MPPARRKQPDPATRAVRKRQLLERFEQAEDQWGAAMRAHRVAPPDLGFASRLRALGEAAAAEAAVCRDAVQLGLAWRPIPGAENAEPPYELRPGTGRRGPEDLWAQFDAAVARLNQAITGSDAAAVSDAFGGVAEAAAELADAVDREDQAAREASSRARARGAA